MESVQESTLGVRYIGCGSQSGTIELHETPGNALGAYLDGASIIAHCNVQDATGDTMNDGEIIIHGNTGDACGYGMRGGKIYVKGNAGYRAGIHMKEYTGKKPILCIGGKAGSFLGEYQAGGLIIVLDLEGDGKSAPVGNFCGTGMHGGQIFLRTSSVPSLLPPQVQMKPASAEDLDEIRPVIADYCERLSMDFEQVMSAPFAVLTPNSQNPYKRLYVSN